MAGQGASAGGVVKVYPGAKFGNVIVIKFASVTAAVLITPNNGRQKYAPDVRTLIVRGVFSGAFSGVTVIINEVIARADGWVAKLGLPSASRALSNTRKLAIEDFICRFCSGQSAKVEV
jgi:hypothetical protein